MIRMQTSVPPKIVVVDDQGRHVRLFVNSITHYYPTDDGMGTVVGVNNKELVFLVTLEQFEECIREANTTCSIKL